MNKKPPTRLPTKTEQIRVRTTPQVLRIIDQAAETLGMNRSDYINHLLLVWVQNGCRYPGNYDAGQNAPSLKVADAPRHAAL